MTEEENKKFLDALIKEKMTERFRLRCEIPKSISGAESCRQLSVESAILMLRHKANNTKCETRQYEVKNSDSEKYLITDIFMDCYTIAPVKADTAL